MQPQFYYLGLVLFAFSLFGCVVLFLQISDVRYRKTLAGQAKPVADTTRE